MFVIRRYSSEASSRGGALRIFSAWPHARQWSFIIHYTGERSMRSAVHRPLCRFTVIMRRSPTTRFSTFMPGGSRMCVFSLSTMKVSRISTSVR
jgi:hypothetical protein